MKCDILALRPNCLLTRYPIIFVNPPKSLFHHAGLAEPFLKKWLLAHGYQINEINLPYTSNSKKLMHTILNFLKRKKIEKSHFVITNPYLTILLSALEHSLTKASSITNIHTSSEKSITQHNILIYKAPYLKKVPYLYTLHSHLLKKFSLPLVDYSLLLPHTDKEIADRFLDHFIELAEDDYCTS